MGHGIQQTQPPRRAGTQLMLMTSGIRRSASPKPSGNMNRAATGQRRRQLLNRTSVMPSGIISGILFATFVLAPDPGPGGTSISEEFHLSNTAVPCRQCGYPTTGAVGVPDICPLCAADNLKGGPMVCKKCKKSCTPIGATLRGIQLVGCPGCGLVYADIPGAQITRGGQTVSHRSHNPEKVCSTHTPATKKPTVKKAVKITEKVTFKKAKVTVKSKNKR